MNDIEDMEVAEYMATLGWMRDGIRDGLEIDVLGRLSEIAEEAVELALSVMSLPWVQDGIDGTDGRLVGRYADMARRDVAFAQEMFTLEYSYELSQGRVEVPIEIVERYEDGFVVRQRSLNLAADSRWTRRTERFYLGPPPSVDWWPAGSYVLRVYQGGRVIAEVEYEVAPIVVG